MIDDRSRLDDAYRRRRRSRRSQLARPALHRAGDGAGAGLLRLPLVLTVWMSLHNWPLMGGPRCIGVRNYVRHAARHPLLAALELHRLLHRRSSRSRSSPSPFRWRSSSRSSGGCVTAYRTIIFLPVVVGFASASLLWVWLPTSIPACSARAPGRARPDVERQLNLLAEFDTAFWSIIVMVVWKIAGFTMIILLTGLQAIPTELQRGGADRRRRAAGSASAHLTLPLMRRTHRAGADPLGHRLDPRLRPVLHHDLRAARRTR